jgi:hypothetical protein
MINLQHFDIRKTEVALLFELRPSDMNSPEGRHFTVSAFKRGGGVSFVINQNDANANPSLIADAFAELIKIYAYALGYFSGTDDD